ncbi:unnamed protein product, partial [Ectocarpus sp. 12 AP-2014]
MRRIAAVEAEHIAQPVAPWRVLSSRWSPVAGHNRRPDSSCSETQEHLLTVPPSCRTKKHAPYKSGRSGPTAYSRREGEATSPLRSTCEDTTAGWFNKTKLCILSDSTHQGRVAHSRQKRRPHTCTVCSNSVGHS